MSKLFKIGIPILIALLMVVVVGTGIALAKERDASFLTGPTAADTGYSNGTWVGCWNGGYGYCSGPGAGYGPGGWYGANSGNYPPCHGY